MKLLHSVLVLLGCCALLYLPETSLADETNNPLSAEHMHYISLECEGFAKEDDVSSEKHPAYIKACIKELSTAVLSAIKQLEVESESPVMINSNNDPLEN